MTVTPLISNCDFHAPSRELWAYTLSTHASFLMLRALPIGAILFFTPSRRRKYTALGMGVTAAVYAANYKAEHWVGAFLASVFGFSTFFKCVNIGWGQFPPGADENIVKWLLWFVIIPEPQFAKGKFVRTTPRYFLAVISRMFWKCIALFFLLSLIRSEPMPNYIPLSENIPWIVAIHIQGFVHTWFVYLLASSRFDFFVLMASFISGSQFMTGFDNPLLNSRTFSQCWGDKWNRPVHELLKRTVYIPVRKTGYGKTVAALSTFFVSGLLHEYNFSIHNRSAYEPGKATLFFMSMGIYVFIEAIFWHNAPPSIYKLAAKLPSPVTASWYAFLAAGLVEEFFIVSWLKVGAIASVADIVPHVVCTNSD